MSSTRRTARIEKGDKRSRSGKEEKDQEKKGKTHIKEGERRRPDIGFGKGQSACMYM